MNNTEPNTFCCSQGRWVLVADLGHTDGVDFVLGKCSACQNYWMNFWIAATSVPDQYVAVSAVKAREFLSTASGPSRKKILSDWWNDL